MLATTADLLVTAKPCCLMQVAAALQRHGGSMVSAHTIKVTDASIRRVILSAPPLEGD